MDRTKDLLDKMRDAVRAANIETFAKARIKLEALLAEMPGEASSAGE